MRRVKRLLNGIVFGSPEGLRIIINHQIGSVAYVDAHPRLLAWLMSRTTVIDQNGKSWTIKDITPIE